MDRVRMHHFDYGHVAELREKLIPYATVEKFVNPSSGDVIVDIGAGDGFYSVNFAKKVGPGKIISVEIDERGTSLLRGRMKENGVGNIQIEQQNACDEFQFKGFNKVFFSNTFHDLPCRSELVARLARSGNKGMEIILIEFKKEDHEFGPPENIRISEEELKREFGSQGFKFAGREELSHHYLHKYVRE